MTAQISKLGKIVLTPTFFLLTITSISKKLFVALPQFCINNGSKVIGFSFHGYTFVVSIDDEIRAKYAESEFNIQFFEEILEDDIDSNSDNSSSEN